ncbi:MAG: prolyl oligopeptidase family serine peptidase [Candidatus Promineifilaceae bacterium]
MHAPKWQYPSVRRSDLVEVLHGKSIADPYRWLEDPNSAETKAFVTAQSDLTDSYLSEIPARPLIHQRLSKLYNYQRLTSPNKKGSKLFFWQNDGLQNQPVLMVQTGLDGVPSIALDPNTLSENGTSAVTGYTFNEAIDTLTYTVTHGGSDWQEIHICSLATGQTYDEVLRFARFPSIAWHPDNSGFFYNGHDDPANDISANANKNNRIYWHTLGTPQSADTVVYERPDLPEWGLPVEITDDKQYLVSRVWFGAINRNRLYYRPVDQTGDFIPLIDEADAEYSFLGNSGRTFYVRTDLDAPNYRIVAIDLDRPERHAWREIIPEQADSLAFAGIVNQQFVLGYLHNAYHQVRLASLDGSPLGEIELPTLGSITSLTGSSTDSELFLDFYSFLYPATSFHYDFNTGQLTPWNPPQLDFDTSEYETNQIFATSKDGTQVPIFITHRRGIELDGSHPLILYGYGGFSISLSPRFSTSRLQWLEMGGIFAQVVLRGGAEFGESWHRAGMLGNKQNVFDDFIGAAEHVIQSGYTKISKLAIEGGSNGGLLVAACMVQRPELFGAVICHVPVIDMLRYQKFTAGRYWVPEYGDPDDADEFAFMLAYSPLHNVLEGTTYPPTLILTADHDDRVVPSHAHKFASELQYQDAKENPLLLRFEFNAGHGFGKSVAKLIDQSADVHAFLVQVLNLETLAIEPST